MITSGNNTPDPLPQELEAAQERYLKKIGRSSQFTQETATEIINRLADGETLRAICRDKHMPSNVTVYDWANHMPAFASAIAYARRIQASSFADEALELVDTAETTSMAHVQKADKRANLRMRLAGCFDRDTYGDKVTQDVNIRGVTVTTTCKELKDLLNGV